MNRPPHLPRAALALTLGLVLTAPAVTQVTETWDQAAQAAHNWYYWDAADHPMDWSPTGGVNDSGHVSAPLDALVITQASHWPAYWFVAWDDPSRATQLLDLVTHPRLDISLRLAPGTDLGSSTVRFFIGEWNEEHDQVFYAFQQDLAVGSDWTTSLAMVGNPDPARLIHLDLGRGLGSRRERLVTKLGAESRRAVGAKAGCGARHSPRADEAPARVSSWPSAKWFWPEGPAWVWQPGCEPYRWRIGHTLEKVCC